MQINVSEVFTRFSTQEACIGYLEGLRWQHEPECPYCKGKQSSQRKDTYRH
uniref:transposase n=1 Tax=uncultured Mucilaginibacter sp. TaxID=797541 RepID=UPI003448DE7B